MVLSHFTIEGITTKNFSHGVLLFPGKGLTKWEGLCNTTSIA